MLGFLRVNSIHPLNFGLQKQMNLDESDESEDSDVSDNSSQSSDEDIGKVSNITDAKKYFVGFTIASMLALEGADMLRTPCFRKGNQKRDRTGIHLWSKQLDDVMFSRQFRLHREDFYYVLLKISCDLQKNEQKAINLSGSTISPYLMQLITLRMLAGASYLDMIHYRVHIDSVHAIVWKTVCAITKNIDNINVARTEDECLKLSREW